MVCTWIVALVFPAGDRAVLAAVDTPVAGT